VQHAGLTLEHSEQFANCRPLLWPFPLPLCQADALAVTVVATVILSNIIGIWEFNPGIPDPGIPASFNPEIPGLNAAQSRTNLGRLELTFRPFSQ